MSFSSNVAPRRRVREPHKPWTCKCFIGSIRTIYKQQPASIKRCLECLAVRP